MKVHRFYRDNDPNDTRAYIEIEDSESILDENGDPALYLRVDDDYYDCEMTRAQALALARAIIAALAPS